MKQLATAAVIGLFLNSCNTFIGVGRDIRQLGSGMENTAHGRTFDGKEKEPEPAPAPDPNSVQ